MCEAHKKTRIIIMKKENLIYKGVLAEELRLSKVAVITFGR